MARATRIRATGGEAQAMGVGRRWARVEVAAVVSWRRGEAGDDGRSGVGEAGARVCFGERDWEMAMSLMQAPQRERSRQSVRTRQYCCSSAPVAAEAVRLESAASSQSHAGRIAKLARDSIMQANKAPAVGRQTPALSPCRLQAKRGASDREAGVEQGCTATQILEAFSN